MNNNNLLDKCLSILHSIKADKAGLEKLLEFMEGEFVSKAPIVTLLPDYKLQIDEKYRPVVKDIADSLGAGEVVFVNPENLEIDHIPIDYEIYTDDLEPEYKFDYKRVKKWIKIEPLESRESYKIMESFVESLPEGKEKNKLANAVGGYKPFANFSRLIHNSRERENWFKYRICRFEKYVIDNYLAEITNQSRS